MTALVSFESLGTETLLENQILLELEIYSKEIPHAVNSHHWNACEYFNTLSHLLSLPIAGFPDYSDVCDGLILSPKEDKSGKLGNLAIMARCEVLGSKNGLSVYATMKDSAGNFKKDPLNNNILLDESSPVSL